MESLDLVTFNFLSFFVSKQFDTQKNSDIATGCIESQPCEHTHAKSVDVGRGTRGLIGATENDMDNKLE